MSEVILALVCPILHFNNPVRHTTKIQVQKISQFLVNTRAYRFANLKQHVNFTLATFKQNYTIKTIYFSVFLRYQIFWVFKISKSSCFFVVIMLHRFSGVHNLKFMNKSLEIWNNEKENKFYKLKIWNRQVRYLSGL